MCQAWVTSTTVVTFAASSSSLVSAAFSQVAMSSGHSSQSNGNAKVPCARRRLHQIAGRGCGVVPRATAYRDRQV